MRVLIQRGRGRLIDVAIRVVLAVVFVYAGSAKIAEPQALADSIASFRILPRALVSPLALGLPPFEIAAGLLLLLVGWARRAAALAIVMLTAVFAIALASALARGVTVDCGCFGAGGAASLVRMWLDLARDVPLLAGAWISYRLPFRHSTSADAS